MSQVYVSPNSQDTGLGLMSVVLVIVALIVLGIIAYYRGWFSMGTAATNPTPMSNINITTPTPAPNPTPTATTPAFSVGTSSMRY